MKIVLLSIMLMALAIPPTSMACRDGIQEVDLHTNGTPGNVPRSLDNVPVTCYVIDELNSLVIYSDMVASSAIVYWEKASTGVFSQSVIQLSTVPQIIVLSGCGSYFISIELVSEAVYWGQFTI